MNKRIFYVILSLLGFAAAGGGCGMAAYGSPWAEFNAKGSITEKETGESIEGIKVFLMGTDYREDEYLMSSAMTDHHGNYTMSTEDIWVKSQQLKFIARDVDGMENGGYFAPVVVLVDVNADDFKGAKGWFEGRAEKKVDFVMVKTQIP